MVYCNKNSQRANHSTVSYVSGHTVHVARGGVGGEHVVYKYNLLIAYS